MLKNKSENQCLAQNINFESQFYKKGKTIKFKPFVLNYKLVNRCNTNYIQYLIENLCIV